MIRDNTRFGYYCSIALHTTVVVAAILWVVIKSIFPDEKNEPIDPFEMVEPPAEQQQPEQPQTPESTPEIQQQQDLKPLDKIELPPEPEPTPPEEVQPEPTPPEPKPEPEPAPSPKPKKVEKPKPPKKVSYNDFKKRNPKVTNRKQPTSPRATVAPKIGKITANTSNISTIANIKTTSGTSAAMRNILSSYISEIRRKAKASWAIPATAQSTDWVVVAFQISSSGVISGLHVESRSGNTEFDNSVLAAIRSITIPPPPDNNPHAATIKFNLK